MSEGRASERRQGMTGRRFASNAEADAADAAYWLAIPEAERVLQVWRLSLEQWSQRENLDDAPRLHRAITRVRGR
jgi:hypothetical protein